MPQVWNKRDLKVPPVARYVGRSPAYRSHLGKCNQCNVRPLSLCSKGIQLLGLGNPFEIGRDGDRKKVLLLFTDYCIARMARDTEYYNSVMGLKGHDLVCWCAPLACHADVYLSLANEEAPWVKSIGSSSGGGSSL